MLWAASAKERLDVVIRDAINNGDIPGPRYLANGKEMARRDGELVAGITAHADGPDEMREVIQHHIGIGVDQIKLSMSGEEVKRMVYERASPLCGYCYNLRSLYFSILQTDEDASFVLVNDT